MPGTMRDRLHYITRHPEDHFVFFDSERGSVEGTRLLLEHGANIDAETNKGETPLQLALKVEHREMVEFLSGLGAK
jgi:ankyrin repeat protein